MKLEQLLKDSDVKVWQGNAVGPGLMNVDITKITLDSRACSSGTLFVAAPGATPDSKNGHGFIAKALQNGAEAVVLEAGDEDLGVLDVPVFVSNNSRKLAATLSERLSGSPSQKLSISGVTGTNGKTSVTFFLAGILKAAGFRSGVVGTLGVGDVESPIYTGFTTPEAEILSPALAKLHEEGFTHVAMEVSSHALGLFRCDGIKFSAAAFLNLTEEHLDFHRDMASYRKAKERLFLELLPVNAPAIVPVGDALFTELKKRGHKVLSFGRNEDADIYVSELSALRHGTRVNLHLGAENAFVDLCLFGDYNLENVMCAAGLAFVQGVPSAAIFEALKTLKAPPGRLEAVAAPDTNDVPLVLVDFAHSPDALKKVLTTTRAFTKCALKLVFGCGGNRDFKKRPIMGEIASRLADEVWITNDNPRNEDPQKIIRDIYEGVEANLRPKFKIVQDRENAIREAIDSANPQDVVLVAGKGHEATQQIGDQYLPFSDMSVARKALEDWRK